MKKESWALILSGIAIAISIATACFCIFRIQPFTYDSMTLTVSVLVAVVTIYMFIHIINEFLLEKKIKHSIKKDIDKRIYKDYCINRTQGQWRINRDIEFNERIIMFATSR